MATLWTLHGDGKTIRPDTVVAPDERLSWPRTIGIGAQHVVAMFGATFLVPLLTHFPPSTTLLFSGIGTIGFLLITRNRLPSYLGSSFAFIAPITAATAGHGMGGALFGILAVGILLAIVGGIVVLTGTGWIDALMPPVVAGAIVALIGFNLAPTAVSNFSTSPPVAIVTLAAIILCTVLFRGMLGRMSIFVGVVIGYLAAVLLDQQPEPGPHDGMIVDEQYLQRLAVFTGWHRRRVLGAHGDRSSAWCPAGAGSPLAGTRSRTSVPDPHSDSTIRSPPTLRARSRMVRIPVWAESRVPASTASQSKPTPSSSMIRVSQPSHPLSVTDAELARECLATLVSACCAMRYTTTSSA